MTLNPALPVTPLAYPATPPAARPVRPLLQALEKQFAQPFVAVDAIAGDVVCAPTGGFTVDCRDRLELLAEIAARGRVEIVEDESPICVVAVPLEGMIDQKGLVAVAPFLTRAVRRESEIESAASVLGVKRGRAFRWARSREPWNVRTLVQLAETTAENLRLKRQVLRLSNGMNEALVHARDTYIELGLLHRLSRRLHVADSEEDLWRHALKWLSDAVPARMLALVPVDGEGSPGIICHGERMLDDYALSTLVCDVRPRTGRLSFALNRAETTHATWRHPAVREMACVPVVSGDDVRAWLIAINHRGGSDSHEFGAIEIRLLDSIAAILSIHSNNSRLFRRQGDLFVSSVSALASAIDAKDRYTSGHSDRVARLSVCLAEQLGLGKSDLDVIYLGGLLHDIGKIGIDDLVLNKPGDLTDEEFQHIKLHPTLGYDILKGVRPLEKILPIVLHHHEAWNGRGYPHGLNGEQTPLLARIVAVADSFDAMTSSRPYRDGMPVERVEKIFRDEAGSQWDPAVVGAYFARRDDFRKIAAGAPDQPRGRTIDPTTWIQ
ncbi:MAG: HD-GYP domain-containing protein [Pirellulales bacterium]|nr:HD-GYP domain-containing protein [Pirellulales bacterium]